MSRATQKIIALLLILWLPLVSGNAVARTMLMSLDEVQQNSMAECPEHAGLHAHSDSTCAQCQFCQMACAACLASSLPIFAVAQLPRATFPPFFGKLHTLTFPPLDPPPIGV